MYSKSRVFRGLCRSVTLLLGGLSVLTLSGCSVNDGDSDSASDAYVSAINSDARSRDDKRTDNRRASVDVLRFTGVKAGDTVVDLLGGEGFYSELLAHVVGSDGVVYLQNTSLFLNFSGKGLEARLKNGRLSNVIRLDSDFADLQLPEDVDVIFIGLAYHDIYVPREDPVLMTSRDEFFPQIWDSLRPGGHLVIVDHAARPGSGTDDTASLHRIGEQYAIEDFERAGFELVDELDVLRNAKDDYSKDIWDKSVYRKTDRFILRFRKPN